VDTLAALLAEAVFGQWWQAAVERRLVITASIPLRWSLSDKVVMGSVAAAVGVPERSPAFPPLPQRARIIEADLRAGGGRAELHHVYAGLASGRVVVLGEPGGGKSGTAILLLLDALTHRDGLNKTQRTRVPVPVLLTAHGWDPGTCSVRDWLRDQLIAIYPLFKHRNGRAEATELVAARDKVAFILDGLDEMDEALRPIALQALCDAPFRVVVLTRSQEMVQAASGTWLAEAVVVQLGKVTVAESVAYLRARTEPPPTGWPDLITHLSEKPDDDDVLVCGLSTPLTLTLLRDTYHASDDVGELLLPNRFSTTEAVEQHLIARVLPAAYAPRPGRPPPRYTEQQARQTLSFIARKMGKDRDLFWWQDIRRWAPIAPRVLATGLALWLLFWLPSGLRLGLVIGLVIMIVFVPVFQLKRLGIANSRATISREALKNGLIFGLMIGLMYWLLIGVLLSIVEKSVSTLVFGLVFGLAIGFVVGFLPVLIDTGIWQTVLAWFQLQLVRQVPAVSLIPFLEDARKRDILRTVGAVYQFRHAKLQDQLAGQATMNSASAQVQPPGSRRVRRMGVPVDHSARRGGPREHGRQAARSKRDRPERASE
jgi:hypothetical protein